MFVKKSNLKKIENEDISLGLPSEHSFSKGERSLHISNPRQTRHF